ncbi:MAG: hypothetical protein H7Z17_21055, partial [Fuerstia sp.]|nr:hypothetical protein [Fuerstiella sp.]
MRVITVAICLSCFGMLIADPASSQPPKAATLTARIEVDEHEHCFTARFFLQNDSVKDLSVTYGRGGRGLEVVPTFHVSDSSNIFITPPTYLGYPERALRKHAINVPAGKEVLYGTFTMGYPHCDKERDEEITASIQFDEFPQAITTEAVRFTIPAQKPNTAAAGIATIHELQATDRPGEWVTSDNGDLSLRLRVKSARIAAQDSMFVIADIRNNRTDPVTIIRPFGDPWRARGSQLKIWGEKGRVEYSGAIADYVLNATSFVTLRANETFSDTLELSVANYAGSDKAGTYTLRFEYSNEGGWDEIVAKEGIKPTWRGSICSREI